MSDPERAIARLRQDNKVADCVIFCAQVLGEAAFRGFNMLPDDEKTTSIPAVLLLDEPQKGWKKQAALCEIVFVFAAHHDERPAAEARRAVGRIAAYPTRSAVINVRRSGIR